MLGKKSLISFSEMITSWWLVPNCFAIRRAGSSSFKYSASLKPTVKVSTGRDICSDISATFAEESQDFGALLLFVARDHLLRWKRVPVALNVQCAVTFERQHVTRGKFVDVA